MFVPNRESKLPEGLELGEELTKIAQGTSSHMNINNTDRKILLKCRMELGRVHMVKSVLPIPNPPDQKYTREEELPRIKVTNEMDESHQLT